MSGFYSVSTSVQLKCLSFHWPLHNFSTQNETILLVGCNQFQTQFWRIIGPVGPGSLQLHGEVFSIKSRLWLIFCLFMILMPWFRGQFVCHYSVYIYIRQLRNIPQELYFQCRRPWTRSVLQHWRCYVKFKERELYCVASIIYYFTTEYWNPRHFNCGITYSGVWLVSTFI